MKTSRFVLYACLLVFIALLAACKNQEQPADTQEGIVTDSDSLVTTMQAAGASVEPAGTVEQPFFTPLGQVITIDGQDVQVFEYDSLADADAESDLVTPDGSSVGTSIMSWIATPHFYKSGRVIVLYVGDQNDTIDALEAALGIQFAGS
jgi:hypothetical protein